MESHRLSWLFWIERVGTGWVGMGCLGFRWAEVGRGWLGLGSAGLHSSGSG